jgi:hypothetical protein
MLFMTYFKDYLPNCSNLKSVRSPKSSVTLVHDEIIFERSSLHWLCQSGNDVQYRN